LGVRSSKAGNQTSLFPLEVFWLSTSARTVSSLMSCEYVSRRISLPPKLKEILESLAVQHGVSVSTLIGALILEKHLRRCPPGRDPFAELGLSAFGIFR